MPYSKFRKITEVAKKFKLQVASDIFFPTEIRKIQPSLYLVESLKMSKSIGYANEKERSERLVAPILNQLAAQNNHQITVYSGRDLDVDSTNDLNGECDFLLGLGKLLMSEVMRPLFSIVEAKEQDLRYGLAQCAAQLYGTKLFNEQDGIQLPKYYGASTTGDVWCFLKLEADKLTIDETKYFLSDLELLLGRLQFLVDDVQNTQ
jgi:hypothetical protein